MQQSPTLAAAASALRAPFPSGVEQYRVGPTWELQGDRLTRPLAYIDARAVFARLDDAVGPDNWSTQIQRLAPGVYSCQLTVCGITRSDVGQAGENEGEQEKSGVSDAVKRAAVQFGIGAYLYERDLPAVKLERRGNDWVLPRNWQPEPSSPRIIEAVPSPSSDTPWLPSAPPASDARPASAAQIRKIQSEARRLGWSHDALTRKLRGRQASELSSAEASRVIEHLLKTDTRHRDVV